MPVFRLADYFLVVSYGDDLDPIDTAQVTENLHIEPDCISTTTTTTSQSPHVHTSSQVDTLVPPSISTRTTASTPSESSSPSHHKLHHVVSEPIQLATPPRTSTLSAEALAEAEAAVASAIAETPHHVNISRSQSHQHTRASSHLGMNQTNPQQTQLGIFSRRSSNTIPSPHATSSHRRRSPSSSLSISTHGPRIIQPSKPPAFISRVYKARVVDRFPRQDYPEQPFPPGIAMVSESGVCIMYHVSCIMYHAKSCHILSYLSYPMISFVCYIISNSYHISFVFQKIFISPHNLISFHHSIIFVPPQEMVNDYMEHV